MKCSKCEGNNSIIKIENYRLHFYKCCYGHDEYDFFENYKQAQKIPNNLVCAENGCQLPKTYFEQFHKCLNCTKILGSPTYYCNKHSIHKNHKTVKYDEKSYYCPEHFNQFVSYCINCNKNLCDQCEKEHKEKKDRIDYFNTMISKEKPIKDIKNELSKIKENISNLGIIVNEIKRMIDGAVNVLEKYCDIVNDIIRKYELYNTTLKNYQVIRTIHYLADSNREIMNDLELILNKENKDWIQKSSKLINIYLSDRTYYKEGNMIKNNNRQNNGSDKDEDEKKDDNGSIKINKTGKTQGNAMNKNKGKNEVLSTKKIKLKKPQKGYK